MLATFSLNVILMSLFFIVIIYHVIYSVFSLKTNNFVNLFCATLCLVYLHIEIRYNIMITCLIQCWAAKTALNHHGMDSTRPLKVICGISHQDVAVDADSPVSCEVENPWIRIFCSAQDAQDWIEIGNLVT